MNKTIGLLVVCGVLWLNGCGGSGTGVEMPTEPVPPPAAPPQGVAAPPPTAPSVD
jgi:hypothetical protein